MTELKPCPACGGSARRRSSTGMEFWCACVEPDCCLIGPIAGNPFRADDRWNSLPRHDDPIKLELTSALWSERSRALESERRAWAESKRAQVVCIVNPADWHLVSLNQGRSEPESCAECERLRGRVLLLRGALAVAEHSALNMANATLHALDTGTDRANGGNDA